MNNVASKPDERKPRLSPGYNPAIRSAAERRRQLRESGALYSTKDAEGQELEFVEVDAGKNGHGSPVTYAYSLRKNEHGYFVSCRIVHRKLDGPKRLDFAASRRRLVAQRRAETLASKFAKGELSRSPTRSARR